MPGVDASRRPALLDLGRGKRRVNLRSTVESLKDLLSQACTVDHCMPPLTLQIISMALRVPCLSCVNGSHGTCRYLRQIAAAGFRSSRSCPRCRSVRGGTQSTMSHLHVWHGCCCTGQPHDLRACPHAAA